MKRILEAIAFLLALSVLLGCGQDSTFAQLTGGMMPSRGGRTVTYIVAGQSNAVSDSRNHSPISGEGVTIIDKTGDPQRNATLTSMATTSICWFIAGNILHQETGKYYRFVNVAVGGTSSHQWQQTYISRVIDEIRAYNPDAVLWVQGEADSSNGATADYTYNNLKSMIELANTSTPGRVVPWYVALCSYNNNAQRQAESRIISERIAKQGPDIDALRTPDTSTDNGIHLSGRGLDQFGQEWATTLSMGGF